LHYNTPQQKNLDQITLSEAKQYMADGHFAVGSMKPKMEAVIRFLENGGPRALITDPDHLEEALNSQAGTWIVPN